MALWGAVTMSELVNIIQKSATHQKKPALEGGYKKEALYKPPRGMGVAEIHIICTTSL
jgi:hypothetical protein